MEVNIDEKEVIGDPNAPNKDTNTIVKVVVTGEYVTIPSELKEKFSLSPCVFLYKDWTVPPGGPTILVFTGSFVLISYIYHNITDYTYRTRNLIPKISHKTSN